MTGPAAHPVLLMHLVMIVSISVETQVNQDLCTGKVKRHLWYNPYRGKRPIVIHMGGVVTRSVFASAIWALRAPAATCARVDLLMNTARWPANPRQLAAVWVAALERPSANASTVTVERRVQNVRPDPRGKGARNFAFGAPLVPAMADVQGAVTVNAWQISKVQIVTRALRDITGPVVISIVLRRKRAVIMDAARRSARASVTKILRDQTAAPVLQTCLDTTCSPMVCIGKCVQSRVFLTRHARRWGDA